MSDSTRFREYDSATGVRESLGDVDPEAPLGGDLTDAVIREPTVSTRNEVGPPGGYDVTVLSLFGIVTQTNPIFVVRATSGGSIVLGVYSDYLSLNGNLLRNVADPLLDQDAATKIYVDDETGAVAAAAAAALASHVSGDPHFSQAQILARTLGA